MTQVMIRMEGQKGEESLIYEHEEEGGHHIANK